MLRRVIKLSLIGLTVGLFSVTAIAKKPGGGDDGYDPYPGNGSPSGPHYNLNLIGMDGTKTTDGSNGNGHRIFVRLGSSGQAAKTTILLGNSSVSGPCPDSFCVTDYDGTDGDAMFYLPNPDDDCDGETSYSVFARAVGSGYATLTSCLSDDGPGNTETDYCSSGSDVVVFNRTNGGKAGTFSNVSRELLYVTTDIGDGTKRYPLFGKTGYEYWWDYDNKGLRLAQLRFYEIPTDVGDAVPIDDAGCSS